MVAFCSLPTRAEYSQRAPGCSHGCLSLQTASIEATAAWWNWTHSKGHLSSLFHASYSCDPARSRPQVCQDVSYLGIPAAEGRMVLWEGGNVLWSLWAEMGFKWFTRQWFVISLIRFGEHLLPLYMDKGWSLWKVTAWATKAQKNQDWMSLNTLQWSSDH